MGLFDKLKNKVKDAISANGLDELLDSTSAGSGLGNLMSSINDAKRQFNQAKSQLDEARNQIRQIKDSISNPKSLLSGGLSEQAGSLLNTISGKVAAKPSAPASGKPAPPAPPAPAPAADKSTKPAEKPADAPLEIDTELALMAGKKISGSAAADSDGDVKITVNPSADFGFKRSVWFMPKGEYMMIQLAMKLPDDCPKAEEVVAKLNDDDNGATFSASDSVLRITLGIPAANYNNGKRAEFFSDAEMMFSYAKDLTELFCRAAGIDTKMSAPSLEITPELALTIGKSMSDAAEADSDGDVSVVFQPSSKFKIRRTFWLLPKGDRLKVQLAMKAEVNSANVAAARKISESNAGYEAEVCDNGVLRITRIIPSQGYTWASRMDYFQLVVEAYSKLLNFSEEFCKQAGIDYVGLAPTLTTDLIESFLELEECSEIKVDDEGDILVTHREKGGFVWKCWYYISEHRVMADSFSNYIEGWMDKKEFVDMANSQDWFKEYIEAVIKDGDIRVRGLLVSDNNSTSEALVKQWAGIHRAMNNLWSSIAEANIQYRAKQEENRRRQQAEAERQSRQSSSSSSSSSGRSSSSSSRSSSSSSSSRSSSSSSSSAEAARKAAHREEIASEKRRIDARIEHWQKNIENTQNHIKLFQGYIKAGHSDKAGLRRTIEADRKLIEEYRKNIAELRAKKANLK